MIGKVRYGKSIIQYSIVKSKRRKTSQIIVDRDNVVVRTPKTKSVREIRNLMEEKAKWIYKKKLELKKVKPSIEKPTFREGSFIPYLGTNYLLRVKTNQKKNSVSLKSQELIITTKEKKLKTKTIQELYEDWLRKKAEKFLKSRLKHLSTNQGVKPSKLVIKKLRNRWGSLTKEGILNLNLNLIKAPKEVIDYIIIHELCHFEIKDHSFRFWNLVRKYQPNYKLHEKWLRINRHIT